MNKTSSDMEDWTMTNDTELKALREMRRRLGEQCQAAHDMAADEALSAGDRAFCRGEWVGYQRAIAQLDEIAAEARKAKEDVT